MQIHKFLLMVLMTSVLFGCATGAPLKAPCDWSGNNCGPKIKINQWDNAGS